jgi:hypothetical protein
VLIVGWVDVHLGGVYHGHCRSLEKGVTYLIIAIVLGSSICST